MATTEGSIEIILNLVESKENFVNSILFHLTSSLLNKKHEDNCTSFRREIETLNSVLQVKYISKQKKMEEDSETLRVIDDIINLCFETLCRFANGKDLCISAICNVLCSSLTLVPENKLCEKIGFIIHKCRSQLSELLQSPILIVDDFHNASIEVTKLGINLRTWESVIDFMILWKEESKHVAGKKSLNIETLFEDEYTSLLLKVISFEHEVLTSQVLLCIIPKLVVLTETNTVLEKIWQAIAFKFCSESNSFKVSTNMFLIMCTLSNYFIPCGNSVQYSFYIGQDFNFWSILQYGLVSDNALIRKQALYLLKRAVEQESIISMPFSHKSEAVTFWWDQQCSPQYQKVWNELFLILEVLEEKQIHLIEPVKPVIVSLIKACEKSFIHSSWILCAIQRALKHENNTVVKWGIVCFTELNITQNTFTNMDFSRILSSLLNALNNSSLYSGNSDNFEEPEIVGKLKSLFIDIVEKQNICEIFFRSLLISMVEISWGPVALFNVVFALAAIPKCPVWKATDLKLLRKFLANALATQVLHIRGAIQSFIIDALINLVDQQRIEIRDLAEILGGFRKNECLKRGSCTWRKLTSWIKSFITEEHAFSFTKNFLNSIINDDINCEMRTAVRMVILLSDAELICLDLSDTGFIFNLNTVLLPLVKCFEDCQDRMYISHVKQNSCLEMFVNLLQESHPISENDATGKCIILLISTIMPGIFVCIKKYMFTANNLECFDTMNMYLNCLSVLSNEQRLCSELLRYAEMLQDASFIITDAESANSPVSMFFSIKILSWISSLINKSNKDDAIRIHNSTLYKKQMKFSENMLRKRNLNLVLLKTQQDKQLTCDLQMLWGRLVSEYMQGTWSLINLYLEILPNSVLSMNSEFASKILNQAEVALESGGRGILVLVMSVIRQIAYLLLTVDIKQDLKRFISLCWAGIFELRKSDHFWVSMETFIKMTFQKCLMSDIEMNETLLIFSQKIFSEGETVTGLCNILLQQLQEVSELYNFSLFEPFVEIVINALVFGPIHRRDRKFEDETCNFIRSFGEKCCINEFSDIMFDSEVRARGIQLLLSCEEKEPINDINVFVKVLRVLLHKDTVMSSQRTRYFADSYHHRLRNRIMQVLLLIEPLLPKEETEELTAYLHDSLLRENHQPSIRYLQEWLLIRLTMKNFKSCSKLWAVLHTASITRPGSLCSFISIVYHIARMLSKNDKEDFIKKAMNEILPHTMAQHFNVRLYAQVSFFKLWEYALEEGLCCVTEMFSVVYASIIACLRIPTALKSVKKLEDFYFTKFHPVEHYSLQTIFYEIPRLTNVMKDEWISAEILRSCGVENTFLPLFNNNDDLKDCKSLSTLVKSGSINDYNSLCSEVVNVQKKIIPWKAMVPDPEVLLSLSESVLPRKQMIADDGLIVVASLIDRLPNLGGLSRTCEVFGVFQYVIGNIKYLEDKQFQTLSVSAERWIPTIEVKPQNLAMYLGEMKCKGFTVLGAEQTSNSVLLNTVKFPRRTLLLLGNEKEGIPVNLLPLLDMCVEIPQQGVIRSLNVHVSGAIFIWEYARQHNVKY